MIQQLKRIAVPEAYSHEDTHTRAESAAAARERLTCDDVPTRLLWRALIATAKLDPPADGEDPALPLAQALLGRSDTMVTTDEEIVAQVRRDLRASSGTAPESDVAEPGLAADSALADFLDVNGLQHLGMPHCAATVRPLDLPDDTTVQVLEVTTEGDRHEELEALWPCIQPLNWPKCNELFDSVEVVSGSYNATPDVDSPAGRARAFSKIVPGLDLHDAKTFGCRYTEVVELPGIAAGQKWLPFVVAITQLDCIEWTKRDAAGHVIEVGMAYRHSPDDPNAKPKSQDPPAGATTKPTPEPADGSDSDPESLSRTPQAIVDVDEGFAVIRVLPDTSTLGMQTAKRISFKDPAGIDLLAGSRFFRDLFAEEWSFNFELTASDCSHRAVITEAQVKAASENPPVGDDPKPADPHWLPGWLDEAAAYWEDVAAVGFRECERLAERRTSSDQVDAEDAFYDALEIWEANRRSLNDGLELAARFWSGILGGRP